MNLNKVFIIGRVTDDVQLKATPSNQSVANFSVATNRVWTDRNTGTKQEDTQFHNVVVWGRQAEIASQFLTKGSMVMIEGRLQTRTWQGNDGQNRRVTEIVCERLQLGPKPQNASKNISNNVDKIIVDDDKSDESEKNPENSDGFDDKLDEGIDEISINDDGDEVSDKINPEDLPF